AVVHILACLAAPSLFWPAVMAIRYMRHAALFAREPALFALAIREDRAFSATLAMAVAGLVTLLEWDALFPDRKDYLNLMPLPVTARDLFAAKLAALAGFLSLFTLAANGLGTLAVPAIT